MNSVDVFSPSLQTGAGEIQLERGILVLTFIFLFRWYSAREVFFF